MSKGISPFIAYALVILLAVSAVSLVLILGLPVIQRSRESITFDIALNNMQQLDSTIREVASEGLGSLRAIQLSVTGGKYFVTNGTNKLVYAYETSQNLIANATNTTRGNIRIEAGQKNGNLTLQYSKINITGSFSVESGNYKICIENAGTSGGNTVINVRVC